MANDRNVQTTLNNLVGGARFKALVGNKLMKTYCPQKECGKIDSWQHFKECNKAPKMEEFSRKEKVDAIVTLCREIRIRHQLGYRIIKRSENSRKKSTRKDKEI